MKARAYALMLVIVAIWGSTFVVVKGALADATPGAFNAVRMTLAFALLAVTYRRHWRAVGRRQLLSGAVAGVFWPLAMSFKPWV